jgi:hypothetical protein
MLKELKESPKIRELKASYPTANVILIFIAIIMLWRGVWGLLDQFLFPGLPVLSHLICLAIGVLILYLDGFSIENLKR